MASVHLSCDDRAHIGPQKRWKKAVRVCVFAHVLPGPQAVGQEAVVQNSERALERRLVFWKNATAKDGERR